MDLSKVFDAIDHKLVIAKLQNGFSTEALEVLLSYPQGRLPAVKIKTTPGTQLLQGFWKGLVVGPMPFNIHINDIFFGLNEVDICKFSDKITPCLCRLNLKSVLEKLEHYSELAISCLKWIIWNLILTNVISWYQETKRNIYGQNWIKI